MLKVVRDTGVRPCLYGVTWELASKAICGYVCFPSILGCLTDFWAELLRLFCEVGQVSIVFLSFLSVGRRQVSFPWQKWRSHRQLCPRRVVSCAGLPAIMSSVCWHFYQRQILALRTINFFFTWPHHHDFMFCDGCILPYQEELPAGWESGVQCSYRFHWESMFASLESMALVCRETWEVWSTVLFFLQ